MQQKRRQNKKEEVELVQLHFFKEEKANKSTVIAHHSTKQTNR
tara:strand:+ start:201 stop:329 length:129 start_codon:yes stop_codon:yes gene_type:complete